MRKYTLSRSETSEIIQTVNEKWPKTAIPSKIKELQVVEVEENSSLLIGEDFLAIKIEQNVLPLLIKEDALQSFPSISVDMGAVKFVCNGAKVMRPGIVKMDEFKKDDIVVVRDNMHGKYLAVGLALASSQEAQTMSKGPVVDNKHYISDKFWEAYKQNK
ncbi:MAG: PUA domain-containing protein [Nitrososphaerales archaeon]